MKTQTVQLPASIQVKSRINAYHEWASKENAFFTSLMEESITNQKTLLISNAVISFSILVTSAFISIYPLLFCLMWFMSSLFLCKKGGLR
ncbi:hypothetical protein [Phocaeicola paurosaccharolyticus]|uniref:hypothetical protein n=1 Tax=Phocaeicola paurosaccharolyticus TaxID=732242 RepID=UPI002FDF6484